MNGIPAIVDTVRRTLERGGSGVLATVVHVRGSAYRRPGARMFFPDPPPADAEPTRSEPVEPVEPAGLVSGGCLEADLAERAREVANSGRATHVVYDTRSPDDIVWGLGLGCDGEIRVLLERVHPGALPADLEQIARHAGRREPLALATFYETATGKGRPVLRLAYSATLGHRTLGDEQATIDGTGLREARAALERSLASGRGEADAGRCIEFLAAPIRLWIFGAGLDAKPVAAIGSALDWTVELFDHRAAMLREDRFPAVARMQEIDPASWRPPAADSRTAALLMTHHFLHDLALLGRLAALPLGYLGVLGPSRRRGRLLERLDSVDARARAGVYGPVGLDIGAETPEEIAISAIAEIQAVVGGRRGGFLKDRDAPLH